MRNIVGAALIAVMTAGAASAGASNATVKGAMVGSAITAVPVLAGSSMVGNLSLFGKTVAGASMGTKTLMILGGGAVVGAVSFALYHIIKD